MSCSCMSRGSSVTIVIMLEAEQPGVRHPAQHQETPGPVLGPTGYQWIKWPEHEAGHSLSSSAAHRLRISGATRPLRRVPSLPARGQFHFPTNDPHTRLQLFPWPRRLQVAANRFIAPSRTINKAVKLRGRFMTYADAGSCAPRLDTGCAAVCASTAVTPRHVRTSCYLHFVSKRTFNHRKKNSQHFVEPNVHHRLHNSLLLVSVLSHINPSVVTMLTGSSLCLHLSR